MIRSLYSMTFKLLYWCHIVPDFDSSTDGQCFPKRKYFYWIINGSDFRDHSSSVESGKLFYFQFLAEARLTDCLFCILYLVTWIWWNMWDYNSFNVITFSHKSQYNSLPQRSRKRTPTYSYSGPQDSLIMNPPLYYSMEDKNLLVGLLSIMTHWMVRLQNIRVSIWFLVLLLLLTYWTETDCAQPF